MLEDAQSSASADTITTYARVHDVYRDLYAYRLSLQVLDQNLLISLGLSQKPNLQREQFVRLDLMQNKICLKPVNRDQLPELVEEFTAAQYETGQRVVLKLRPILCDVHQFKVNACDKHGYALRADENSGPLPDNEVTRWELAARPSFRAEIMIAARPT